MPEPLPGPFNSDFEGTPPLHWFAKALAAHLPGFEYNEKESVHRGSDELKGWANITRKGDGLTLGLSFDSLKRPTRLTVTGELPRYKDGRYYSISTYNKEGDVTRSISLDLRKPYEKIAREIESRLLPGAKKRHEIARAAIAEEEKYKDTHVSLTKMAARILGAKLDPRDLESDRTEFYMRAKDYGDKVKVEGSRLVVTFEITSGDMAGQLEKTIEFVNSLKAPKQRTVEEEDALLMKEIFPNADGSNA